MNSGRFHECQGAIGIEKYLTRIKTELQDDYKDIHRTDFEADFKDCFYGFRPKNTETDKAMAKIGSIIRKHSDNR